jgi:hypothetical protein
LQTKKIREKATTHQILAIFEKWKLSPVIYKI